MKQKLSERIRLLRLSKNLSQQNMADELGLTVAAYSNIERGVTDITVSRLFQISDILGVTASSLIDQSKTYQISEEPMNSFTPSSNDTNWQTTVEKMQDKLLKLENEVVKLRKRKK